MKTREMERVWPEWKIVDVLGESSYGTVCKAVSREGNEDVCAAIKVISVPNDPAEVDALYAEGLSTDEVMAYLRESADHALREIELMEALNGAPHIVRLEEYRVVEKTAGPGWDIYIRMELLTPFSVFACDRKLTEQHVVKLGCDICTALEMCATRDIIHRNIKPENILVNEFGSYKLGDFGTACTLDNRMLDWAPRTTRSYLAPEVARYEACDARADVYSLGIMLYRLLNEDRLPFLDTTKQLLSPEDRMQAEQRRMQGEALPAPCQASPEMTQIILKACAFEPADRYANATEMKMDLIDVSLGRYVLSRDNTKTEENHKEEHPMKRIEKKKNSLPLVLSTLLAAALLAGCGAAIDKQPAAGDGQAMAADAVEGIYVLEEPTVREYHIGQALNTEGLALLCECADGSMKIVSEGYTCSPAALEETGVQTVTVSYEGQTTDFQVNVQDMVFTSYELEVRAISGEEDPTVGRSEDGKGVNWVLYATARYRSEGPDFSVTSSTNVPHEYTGSSDFDDHWREAKDGKSGAWHYRGSHTAEFLNGEGWGGMAVCLADDPSLAGTYQTEICFGTIRKTVTFTLVYDGGYETGHGWDVTDISWN